MGSGDSDEPDWHVQRGVGCGDTHAAGRQGWLDRRDRLDCGHPGRRAGGGLRRVEGGNHPPDQGARLRMGALWDSRQRDRARLSRDRDDAGPAGDGARQSDHRSHSDGARRPSDRPGRPAHAARFRRLLLYDGDERGRCQAIATARRIFRRPAARIVRRGVHRGSCSRR
jgi:hypothetical protein